MRRSSCQTVACPQNRLRGCVRDSRAQMCQARGSDARGAPPPTPRTTHAATGVRCVCQCSEHAPRSATVASGLPMPQTCSRLPASSVDRSGHVRVAFIQSNTPRPALSLMSSRMDVGTKVVGHGRQPFGAARRVPVAAGRVCVRLDRPTQHRRRAPRGAARQARQAAVELKGRLRGADAQHAVRDAEQPAIGKGRAILYAHGRQHAGCAGCPQSSSAAWQRSPPAGASAPRSC